ncbi:MAG: lipid A deacylase LpxR family protein [Sphingomonadales bacterium]
MHRSLLLICGIILAGPTLARPVCAAGTFSFTFENDIAFGTDREYSNGGLFTYTADVGQAPGFLRRFAIEDLGAEAFQLRYGVGQRMYTPINKTATEPLFDERPYVGLLFGQIDLNFEKGTTVHRLSALLGVFGPAALAGRTQNFFHRLANTERVEGWANQIRNEPALNLNYDVTRPVRLAGETALDLDAEPFIGLAFGNVSTGVRAGFVLRFGPYLDGQPTAVSVRSRLEPPRLFRPSDGLRWHVHAGFVGEAEAYSSTVDGNLFRSSQSAPDKTLQWESRAGVMASIGRYWLGLSTPIQSRQHQLQDKATHKLGEVRLGISLF